MAADKDLIVAIELGSYSIRGIAGRRNVDGTLHVLDIVESKTKNCIRKGIVYNIDKTVQALNSIMLQLREDLGVYIDKAYVGIAGQSLCTIRNSTPRQLAEKVVISADIVDELRDSNYQVNYPDKEILEACPQEYRIGTNFITDPVGILSNQIEGNYLNIVARTSLKENIQKCFNAAGIKIIETIVSPLALADNILSDNEKLYGCALVDFGAETTTVSVYKNNILRYLSVIPLGGNNLNLDICSKQIEEEEAEKLKRQYGTAFSENAQKEVPRHIPLTLDPGTTIEEDVLQEITEARMDEIITNVWEQIQQSNYADKLISGIVITGGTANIKNIEKAISYKTKFDKIKIAKTLHTMLVWEKEDSFPQDMNTNTLVSLLAYGNTDCTGEDPNEVQRKAEEKNKATRQPEPEPEPVVVVESAKPEPARPIVEEPATGQQSMTEQTEQEDLLQEEENKNKKGLMNKIKKSFSKYMKYFTEE